jgi:hypothetical protein
MMVAEHHDCCNDAFFYVSDTHNQQTLSPRDIRWISRGLSAGEPSVRRFPDSIDQAANTSLPPPDSRPHSFHHRSQESKVAGMLSFIQSSIIHEYFSCVILCRSLIASPAAANKPDSSKFDEQSNERPVPSSHSSGRGLRQALPALVTTTNLFEACNIPLSRDQKIFTAIEKVSAKASNRQDCQELPRPPSDLISAKTNLNHHVPPSLAQQLYQPSLVQPLKNYELVKEMKLHPRTKASPRAATFLKLTPRNSSITRVAHQSAENSGVPFSKMKSHLSLDPALRTSTTDTTFEIVSGDQKPQSSPHLALVDIRFVFLLPKFRTRMLGIFLSFCVYVRQNFLMTVSGLA